MIGGSNVIIIMIGKNQISL